MVAEQYRPGSAADCKVTDLWVQGIEGKGSEEAEDLHFAHRRNLGCHL